jgi:hypothetical protein
LQLTKFRRQDQQIKTIPRTVENVAKLQAGLPNSWCVYDWHELLGVLVQQLVEKPRIRVLQQETRYKYHHQKIEVAGKNLNVTNEDVSSKIVGLGSQICHGTLDLECM